MSRVIAAAIVTLTCANAVADPLSLRGRWRVVGCETSPRDPADCGRGTIVFTASTVTIDVGAANRHDFTYTLVSSTTDRAVVKIDGRESTITLDRRGAHWRAPGFGGRVGELVFVRE